MTGLPPGIEVAVEFTAGIWTDITSDVDASESISWRVGRTSPFSDPSSAAITVIVANSTGRFTPQRQVLADGVTPHPFWPNVDVRKRIRLSYTIAGTRHVRFLGYVKQWLPQLGSDGHQPQCAIIASDRLDQLSRVDLPHAVLQEILTDAPAAMYSMGEAAGSTAAVESVKRGSPLNVRGQPMAFGQPNPLPAPDGLTGLQITAADFVQGYMTRAAAPLDLGGAQCKTFEAWVTIIGATAPAPIILNLGVYDAIAATRVYVPRIQVWGGSFSTDGGLTYSMGLLTTAEVTGGTPAAGIEAVLPYDVKAHHFVATQNAGTWSFYVDGTLRGTTVSAVAAPASPALLVQAEIGSGGQQAVLGPVAVYTAALSAARVGAHYAAGIGNAGETSGVRVARLLRYAGLASSEINADAGRETLSAQPALGAKVVAACQDVATSEGGGAAFYVAPDGRVRFADRAFRKPGDPVMTVDAGADLDAGAFAPSYDELTLVNSSTVTRDGGTAQTFTDAASVAKFNLTTDSATTQAVSDQAALNLAQWRVRSQSAPGLRLAAVALDLLTATTPGLYEALAAIQIGSRVRVTNLDATASARPTIDLLVEGWTETVGIDQYTVVLDASPADNPPQMMWDDTTNGRWQANGMTLASAITAASSSLSVTTAAGQPKFTTTPARYPLQIQIGQEVLTLPSAPTGASPQVFTGVLRGQANTPAAAQAAGSGINLYPASAWTL